MYLNYKIIKIGCGTAPSNLVDHIDQLRKKANLGGRGLPSTPFLTLDRVCIREALKKNGESWDAYKKIRNILLLYCVFYAIF